MSSDLDEWFRRIGTQLSHDDYEAGTMCVAEAAGQRVKLAELELMDGVHRDQIRELQERVNSEVNRAEDSEAQRLSCDTLLRATLDAMGKGPDADPVISARQLVEHNKRLYERADSLARENTELLERVNRPREAEPTALTAAQLARREALYAAAEILTDDSGGPFTRGGKPGSCADLIAVAYFIITDHIPTEVEP